MTYSKMPISKNSYRPINNISLLPHADVATRSIKYKLYQSSVKYDLRKHFFTNRVFHYRIVSSQTLFKIFCCCKYVICQTFIQVTYICMGK